MLLLFKKFDRLLEKVGEWGLILSLFSILLLAVGSIVLRWMGKSVLWIEPLVRHLVFLSAFLGGSIATGRKVHIRVDLLTKLIEKSSSRFLKWFHQNAITLFSLIVTVFLFKSSFDFFLIEKEFGQKVFLDLHSSWPVFIIPFGTGLIALRFLNQLIIELFNGEHLESDRL